MSCLQDAPSVIASNPAPKALAQPPGPLRVGGGRVNETDALALVIMAWNAQATRPHQHFPGFAVFREVKGLKVANAIRGLERS